MTLILDALEVVEFKIRTKRDASTTSMDFNDEHIKRELLTTGIVTILFVENCKCVHCQSGKIVLCVVNLLDLSLYA